jgi:hypothetical protein
MGDLVVDFATLEKSHSTAVALKAEFDGLPHRYDQYQDSWGKDNIRGAMHNFATNWDYHREVLSGKIQEVGEKIESCLTTFRDADQQLYDQLTKSAEGGT